MGWRDGRKIGIVKELKFREKSLKEEARMSAAPRFLGPFQTRDLQCSWSKDQGRLHPLLPGKSPHRHWPLLPLRHRVCTATGRKAPERQRRGGWRAEGRVGSGQSISSSLAALVLLVPTSPSLKPPTPLCLSRFPRLPSP